MKAGSAGQTVKGFGADPQAAGCGADVSGFFLEDLDEVISGAWLKHPQGLSHTFELSQGHDTGAMVHDLRQDEAFICHGLPWPAVIIAQLRAKLKNS